MIVQCYLKEENNFIIVYLWLAQLTCIKTTIEQETTPTRTNFIIKSEMFSGVPSNKKEDAIHIFDLLTKLRVFRDTSAEMNAYLVTLNFFAEMKFQSMPKYGKNGIIKKTHKYKNVELSERVAEGAITAPPLSLPSDEKKETISNFLKFKEKCQNIFSSIKAFV